MAAARVAAHLETTRSIPMVGGLKLEITTPTGQVYSKEVDMVTLPAHEGELGILPMHVP